VACHKDGCHWSVLGSLAVLALRAAQAFAAEEGLLFYASFDHGTAPEVAHAGRDTPYRSQVKIEPGRIGNAAVIPSGAQLIYEAMGSVYPAAGTASFFWRPDADIAGKSFTILDMSPLDRLNYSRWMRLSYSDGAIDLYCTLGHAGARGLRLAASQGGFAAGAWRHLALAWDQVRGVGIYVDGKLRAQLKQEWVYEGHVNHIGLGLTTRADYRPGGAEFAQSYDELRIYDRWLDDSSIAALAKGETPLPGPLDMAPFLALRRKSYCWNEPRGQGLPQTTIAPHARGIGLRQLGIAQAKDVRRSDWRAFDGERGRPWPGGAGYTNAGKELHVQLHSRQSFDVIQLFGAGALRLVAAPAPARNQTLLEVKENVLGTWAAVLPEPVQAEALAVLRQSGAVYEMGLWQRTAFDPQAAEGKAGWQRLALAPAIDAGLDDPELTRIRRISYTPDRTVLRAGGCPDFHVNEDGTVRVDAQTAAAAVERPGQGNALFPAMRAVHVLGPRHEERQGLDAVALDFAVTATTADGMVHIEVADPLNSYRQAVGVDVGLAGSGPGRLRVLLDLRDMVLLPGARPRLALTFRDDTRIDLARSGVAWRWKDVKAACAEHCRDQLARGRDIFQEISESRPWSHDPKKLKTLGFLRNIIDEMHALEPENSVVSSYWHWIHPGEPTTIIQAPPVPAGLPAWAVYVDAAIPLLKQVPYWWIANRENEFGEFGANDGINDDTDLVQDWWAMHLMHGPDRKLFDSLKRTADNSWRVTMRETGLGHHTDTLHTYEDGMNAQCHMALMDYGNPVYFERLLASARHYKDLLAVNGAGHLHFKSSWYGYDGKGGVSIDTDGRHAHDGGANALTLQPGMLIAWYNGNDYCRKVLTDWTDAMIAHCTRDLHKDKYISGCSVRFDTDEAKLSRSFGYGFFDAPWACYELTGDRKYLDFIQLGIRAEIARYRHPRQTGTVADRYIAETGDAGLKDRFTARVADPAFWKTSLHNDNYYELDTFYLAWQTSGDLRFIDEGTKLTLNDITWELPMLTMGEQSADRVWTPQRLVNRIVLGGPAMLRNELYPKHAVSWENATGRVAPFVRSQGRKHLEVWVCNLEQNPVKLSMRLWRLDHGLYAIREGPDRDQNGVHDGPAESRQVELARYGTVSLSIPARTLWLVTCRQLTSLDDIRQRPDLAVSAEDARYDARNGVLTVVVHNIGAKATGPFALRVTSGGKTLLEEKALGSLDAPADLSPKTVELRLTNLKGEENAVLTIHLDPDDRLSEITEVNNRLEIVPASLRRGESCPVK